MIPSSVEVPELVLGMPVSHQTKYSAPGKNVFLARREPPPPCSCVWVERVYGQ